MHCVIILHSFVRLNLARHTVTSVVETVKAVGTTGLDFLFSYINHILIIENGNELQNRKEILLTQRRELRSAKLHS